LKGSKNGAIASADPDPELGAAKVAAAEPKTTVKGANGDALEGWGQVVDPDGDVRFQPKSSSLMLDVPGTLHVMATGIQKYNAPRVLRGVPADFEAIVWVDGTFEPGDKSTKVKTYPFHGGGLLMWKDNENYVFIQRRAMVGKDGKRSDSIVFEEREQRDRGARRSLPLPKGSTYLRLERKGARVTASVSGDGHKWKSLEPVVMTWSEGPVEVGVFADSTSAAPSTVEFDHYSLKSR
jgi:regulation of enolase protein 1 (concanavalin A-like superfamily)